MTACALRFWCLGDALVKASSSTRQGLWDESFQVSLEMSAFGAYTACFLTLVSCASLHAVLCYLSILVRLGEVLRSLGSLDTAE